MPIWSIDDDPIPATAAQGNPTGPYPSFPPLPQTKPAPWQQPPVTAPSQDPTKAPLDWTLPAYPEANPDWKPSEDEAPVVPDFLKETKPEPEVQTPDEPESAMDKLNIPAYLRVQPLPKKKPRPAPEPEATQQSTPEAQPATPEAQPGEWFTNSVYMRPSSQTPPQEEETAQAIEEPSQEESPANLETAHEEISIAQAIEEAPSSEPVTPADAEESAMQAAEPADPETPVADSQPADSPAEDIPTYSDIACEQLSFEQLLLAPSEDLPAPQAEEAAKAAEEANDTEEGSDKLLSDVPAAEALSDPAADTETAFAIQPDELPPLPAENPSPSGSFDQPESPASEPNPEEEIVALETGLSADGSADTPVAVTPTNRRSCRSRFAARQSTAPEVEESGITSPSAAAVSTEIRHPAEETAAIADGSATRKRRSRRAEHAQEAASAAPEEDARPFVPTVGTEDLPVDASAVRPVDEPSAESTASGMTSSLHAYVRRSPDAAVFTPPVDIDGEDDWKPYAKPFAADTPSFAETPLFSAPDSPFAHDLPPIPDAPEQEWSPFGASQDAPAFPEAFSPAEDSPFAHDLPPIPDAPEQDWSPFGGNDSGKRSGTLYGDSYPDTDLFSDSFQTGSNATQAAPAGHTDTLFPLFRDEDMPQPEKSTNTSLLTETDDLFQDGPSNLSMDESPLYGTSSFDAGDMPNPTRGNLPYDLVSEFDTLNRQKEPLPENPPPLFEDDPPRQEPEIITPDSWTASSPTLQQVTAPLLTKKQAQPKPAKPPINPTRLILLILAVAMAIFCIVAGCKMLMGYVQNTEDWARSHEDFIDQYGVSMNEAGEMVQLPQDGTTFAPERQPVQTAAPSSAEGQHPVQTEDVQPTPKPVQRTKLYQYPDNPLRNPIESITNIQKEYPEVIGRLVIPGVVDEWIMHRNNTYYLNHNYRGTSAEGGAVFMDAACTLDTPPENLHLRASGSVPGKTFHALWQYKTGGITFVYNSEVAHVTTLYEETQYLLYAVIETSGDPANADYFNYASHPTFATDEEMMDYLALARQHSIYNLPTDILPGDRLLTLSTVTGADDSGDQSTNLVLIFRSVR